MKEDELDGLLSEIRSLLNQISERSGSVFYSGRKTFDSPSRYYLMGLNPGGRQDSSVEAKIRESLVSWRGQAPNWSAYLDEYWGGKKPWTREDLGNSGHQQGVRKFCRKCLGVEEVRDVFSANAIFERSEKGEHLPKDFERDRICWEVHQLLFSIVQPTYIICLGHGPGSSFERLKEERCLHVVGSCGNELFKMPSEKKGFYIRWFERDQIQAQVPGLERLVRVIGVPHPSWFALGSDKFRKAWNALSPLSSAPLRGKS